MRVRRTAADGLGRGPRFQRPGGLPLNGRRLAVTSAAVAGTLASSLLLTACTGADPAVLSATSTIPDTSATTATSSASGASTTTDVTAQVRAAAADLAARRAAALAAKDRSAWLATVSDPESAFGVAQAALFDRLLLLPVAGLTARQVEVSAPRPTSGTGAIGIPGATDQTATRVADLRLAYRFTGYDPGERTFDASYTVAQGPSGWRLSGVGPNRTDVQPFDLPDLAVVSSPTALVIGDQPVATLRTYLPLADAAHGRIAAVWGSAQAAVIVVPRTLEELRTQLGRGSTAALDQVAAVTDGPLPSGGTAPSDRVYLNPEAFTRLTASGRRVVVTHELTHVAIRATTTRAVPSWLSEGFADDVGFAGLGLPTKAVAADLLDRVRTGTVPTALPTEANFDPSRGVIAPSYSEAWLAVLRMRQRFGQAKVVAFYRAVAGGPTVDPAVTVGPADLAKQAFVDVLRTTQDAFVADWVAYVRRFAV